VIGTTKSTCGFGNHRNSQQSSAAHSYTGSAMISSGVVPRRRAALAFGGPRLKMIGRIGEDRAGLDGRQRLQQLKSIALLGDVEMKAHAGAPAGVPAILSASSR
jgi:hypothetical protein